MADKKSNPPTLYLVVLTKSSEVLLTTVDREEAKEVVRKIRNDGGSAMVFRSLTK